MKSIGPSIVILAGAVCFHGALTAHDEMGLVTSLIVALVGLTFFLLSWRSDH